METRAVTPNLSFIKLKTPLTGVAEFFCAYLYSGERKAIIDLGPKSAVPGLLATLAELGLSGGDIDYLILTHIHVDHGGGVGTALKEMSRAKVIAHSRARPHLIDPTRLWQASLQTLEELALKYGDIEPVPEDRIIVARDGMKLDLGPGLELEIYLTPGHASHHLSLFERAGGVLIAGEAAGVCVNGGLRPGAPPPFDVKQALASIEKLIELKPRMICYGHFGCYDNAVARLARFREQLLFWHETVNSMAGAGRKPEEILAVLKNQDRNLDYLDRLNRDEYRQEHLFLINTIEGLLDPAG